MKKPLKDYLFTPSGRANRMGFFLANIFIAVASIVPVFLLSIVYAVQMSYPDFKLSLWIVAPILIVSLSFLVALSIFQFFLTVQRLHDLNLSGWFYLVFCLPIINTVFAIYILLAKGTDGTNTFGEDLLKN